MGASPHVGFVEFVGSRGPALHRTAMLLTRHPAAAEDLVQTALAKAWPSWNRIDGDPEAYVRRIIVNEFASAWRRRWRGERPTADLPELAVADHGETVPARQALLRALGTLPPRQRAVLVLRFFHDYTEAYTAETLGIRVGTVKSQTAKALAALRISDQLSDEGRTRADRLSRQGLLR
jgi:RNA polymerase sigma-70 factor (sigma-E family)